MWLFALAAWAYETDQLTFREQPLGDVTVLANAWADELLAEAVAETNRITRCRGSEDRIHREFAQQIERATSRPEFVAGREFGGFGHVEYAARLETADISRRDFLDRSDIYGDLTPGQSLVLGLAGIASTVRLAGELIGTDKVDHFFLLGYQYARASRFGREPDAAYRWGVVTEVSVYGQLTSNVFSYADLAANTQGYAFYMGLLEEGSVFRLSGGCVVQTRGFDWEEWVTPAWDEVLNPSVLNPEVRAAVQRRLIARRAQYCHTWEITHAEDAPRRAEVIAARSAYVVGEAPPSDDLLALDWLCAGGPELAWDMPRTGLLDRVRQTSGRLMSWLERGP